MKLRGQRLEPGEIESVLVAQLSVSAAHVSMAHHPATQETVLVAHVTPQNCNVQLLLRACRQQLPRYMVPSRILPLPGLPQLSSGKVDTQALPAPDWSLSEVSDSDEAPTTELEAQAVAIMEEVLQQDHVGIHTDFFEAGGSSLLAHAVAARLSDTIGAAVLAADIFQHTSAAALAGHVQGRAGSGPHDSAIQPPFIHAAPHSEADRSRGVPCSLNQEQMFLAHGQLAAKHTYNVPMATKLAGTLDPAMLQNALRLLQDRHDALRTGFCAASDERPLQCIQPAGLAAPLVLSQARVWNDTGQSAHDILLEAARAPFDLSSPPLLRALLLEVRLYPLSGRIMQGTAPKAHASSVVLHLVAFPATLLKPFHQMVPHAICHRKFQEPPAWSTTLLTSFHLA